MRLEIPVEQSEGRTRARLAEDLQVLLLAERRAGPLGQVPAEDHRAGADTDVDLRLEDLRHLRGQTVRDDAVGQMVVIAAFGVDDIGLLQSAEDHRPGQAVQFENVEFPPAQAVQQAEVLDQPAVIPGRRDRGRRDVHHPGGRERLADEVGEGGLEDVVPQAGRGQQHSSHGLESSSKRPTRGAGHKAANQPANGMPTAVHTFRLLEAGSVVSGHTDLFGSSSLVLSPHSCGPNAQGRRSG
jgi:hypothetical protein